jgi:hypothetical protein
VCEDGPFAGVQVKAPKWPILYRANRWPIPCCASSAINNGQLNQLCKPALRKNYRRIPAKFVETNEPLDSLREKIENNVIWTLLRVAIIAFSTGFYSYKAILEATNEEAVIKGTYVLKADLLRDYVSIEDYQRLNANYAALQVSYDRLKQQYEVAKSAPSLGPWAIIYEHSRQSIDDFDDSRGSFSTLPIMKDWRALLNDGRENAIVFNGHSLGTHVVIYGYQSKEDAAKEIATVKTEAAKLGRTLPRIDAVFLGSLCPTQKWSLNYYEHSLWECD